MNLRIHRAGTADIPCLARIEEEFSDNTWTAAQLEEELRSPHAHLFCCEVDGETAGFCDLHIVRDDAHVNELCVMPCHRRRGVAHALVRHAIGLCEAHGCAVLTLEVRSKNEPAIALYQKCGFEPAGRRPRFYRAPDDDAINMILRFGPEET